MLQHICLSIGMPACNNSRNDEQIFIRFVIEDPVICWQIQIWIKIGKKQWTLYIETYVLSSMHLCRLFVVAKNVSKKGLKKLHLSYVKYTFPYKLRMARRRTQFIRKEACIFNWNVVDRAATAVILLNFKLSLSLFTYFLSRSDE
jgi:hypothetical protein